MLCVWLCVGTRCAQPSFPAQGGACCDFARGRQVYAMSFFFLLGVRVFVRVLVLVFVLVRVCDLVRVLVRLGVASRDLVPVPLGARERESDCVAAAVGVPDAEGATDWLALTLDVLVPAGVTVTAEEGVSAGVAALLALGGAGVVDAEVEPVRDAVEFGVEGAEGVLDGVGGVYDHVKGTGAAFCAPA